ncbi:MAG TPA: hypothetical protein V6C76_09725 [Drouetiella sp.]
MTEFSTCRHCGHKYAENQQWTATDDGSKVGEFLRSPFNVLIGLVLLGTAYHLVTKHSLDDILGDSVAAVINYGQKKESADIRKYSEILNADPANLVAREKRADAYEELLNGRAAVADYTYAIDISPTANLYRKRATAWDALGEYQKAKADMAEAKRLNQ